jgi:putative salt-induced outer membrane protein
MPRLHSILLLVVLACALPPRVASAADEPPPKPLKATGDFGYVSTAGNSDVKTLNSSDKIEYTNGRWLFTQDGAAVWGTDHGIENAGAYMVGLRADYKLAERIGVYALGSWRRNTFAAIARQFDESVGLVYHALTPQPHQLDLEAGVGVAQRHNTLGDQDDFGTGRLAAYYRYYFREKAYVETSGAYLGNFKNSDDYETDAKAALVAPLGGMLAIKLGYNYHYRNAPPPGFRQWDSMFSSGIQLTY